MASTFFYYAGERFEFDSDKRLLVMRRSNGIDFLEAVAIFGGNYVIQPVALYADQQKVTGFVRGDVISLLIEEREDDDGGYTHVANGWKATESERGRYEKEYPSYR